MAICWTKASSRGQFKHRKICDVLVFYKVLLREFFLSVQLSSLYFSTNKQQISHICYPVGISLILDIQSAYCIISNFNILYMVSFSSSYRSKSSLILKFRYIRSVSRITNYPQKSSRQLYNYVCTFSVHTFFYMILQYYRTAQKCIGVV